MSIGNRIGSTVVQHGILILYLFDCLYCQNSKQLPVDNVINLLINQQIHFVTESQDDTKFCFQLLYHMNLFLLKCLSALISFFILFLILQCYF